VTREYEQRLDDCGHEGVEILGGGKLSFVSLSEIERKLPTFFEGIKVAHSLLEAFR
jgi:hypothetical protein